MIPETPEVVQALGIGAGIVVKVTPYHAVLGALRFQRLEPLGVPVANQIRTYW